MRWAGPGIDVRHRKRDDTFFVVVRRRLTRRKMNLLRDALSRAYVETATPDANAAPDGTGNDHSGA